MREDDVDFEGQEEQQIFGAIRNSYHTLWQAWCEFLGMIIPWPCKVISRTITL